MFKGQVSVMSRELALRPPRPDRGEATHIINESLVM